MKLETSLITRAIGVLLLLVGILALYFALFPVHAQGVPLETPSANIITSQGAAWFAVVALVAVIGASFTRKAVDFVLARDWAKDRIQGDWVLLLAFGISLGWTLFMFQPGILDIGALALLPWWQSAIVVSGMITIGAAGTVDGDARAQKKAFKAADEIYTGNVADDKKRGSSEDDV